MNFTHVWVVLHGMFECSGIVERGQHRQIRQALPKTSSCFGWQVDDCPSLDIQMLRCSAAWLLRLPAQSEVQRALLVGGVSLLHSLLLPGLSVGIALWGYVELSLNLCVLSHFQQHLTGHVTFVDRHYSFASFMKKA